MDLVHQLARLGGVATRAALVRATSRREFDRAVRAGVIERDAHGRYASAASASESSRAANRLAGVLSHRSAALHHGWELKVMPPRPEVTVGRGRTLTAERRAGVEVHWADLSADDVVGHATSWERTIVDCLRSLPFDEALAVADSALRHGHLTKRRLLELAAAIRGPGAPQARRVAAAASHLAAGPFESVLRAIALGVPGLDLRPQVVISDRTGRVRPDLVDERLRLVVEAESYTWHSSRRALRRDCRRYTRLVLQGWLVLRFTWEDVMFHPDYVRLCLETFVSRRASHARRPGGAA